MGSVEGNNSVDFIKDLWCKNISGKSKRKGGGKNCKLIKRKKKVFAKHLVSNSQDT